MQDSDLESDKGSGNSDDGQGSQDQNQSGESWQNDPRFKGKSPEEVYKSYQALETKLGSDAAERKDLEERAKLADESVDALVASRGITPAEARALLREESGKLIEKHAPQIAESRKNSEVQELRITVDKRDLLDDHPEAKHVMDQVLAVARATGKSVKDVYERQFRPLAEKLNETKPMNNSQGSAPRPSNRGNVDDGDDRIADPDRAYGESMEKARSSKSLLQARPHIEESIKARLARR